MAETKKTKLYTDESDSERRSVSLVPANAVTSLTDNSGGTASDTLAAIEGTYTQATVANSVASLAAKIEELKVACQKHGIIV